MDYVDSLLGRLRVGARLNIAFAAVIALMLAIAGFSARAISNLSTQLHDVSVVDAEQVRNLIGIRYGVLQLDLALTKDTLTNDDADNQFFAAQFKRYFESLPPLLKKAISSEDDAQVKSMLGDIGNTLTPALDAYKRAEELGMQNKNAEAQKILTLEIEPLRRKLMEQVEAAIQRRNQLVTDDVTNAEAAAHSALTLSMTIALLAAALGFLFAWMISRSIRNPLQRALNASQAVARGDLAISIGKTGTDEVGQVLHSMGQMAEVLKQFDGALLEIARRHHEGEISYAIPAERFPGSYGRLATTVNDLVQEHIAVKMRVVDVVSRYAVGDLSVDMDRLPKEKAAITNAMDTVKQNLLSINAEIKRLVGAAAAGDFSQRGATERFQYEFRAMLEEFNRLMDVSEQGLRDAVRIFTALAEGDITQQIVNDSGGLFAELRSAANRTTENLEAMVGQIKSATDLVNTAAREISAGNANLSARTEQQAASLEETASSMEELTGNVRQSADNARMANQLAVGARDTATRGGATVEGVVSTMGEINEASRKISDIITVIDGIAFQTNILALNAAVEAARAGDQGRGFAVVASEVRSLAQRSAQAAKEIKTLITDAVSKVSSGVEQVEQAGSTMREIVSSVTRVTDVAAEISSATHEQSSGIEQINKAVVQMDEMTQQNAALVEQASAAARSLEEQAAALAQSVAAFKTRKSALSIVREAPKPVASPKPGAVKAPSRQPEPEKVAALVRTSGNLALAGGDGKGTWAEF
jgi:methyl-accepting chemotaxis protein